MGIGSTLVFASLLAATVAGAQRSAPEGVTAKSPAYDIVSIKPNKTGSGNVSIHTHDGNYTASNVSLETLIEAAYGYKRDQIIGLDGPVSSARFDIRAKVLDPDLKVLDDLSRGQRESMLQPVLTDRFHLKFHTETRVLPVYELVPAKSGAKLAQTSAADVSVGDAKTFHGVNSGSVSMHTTRTTAEFIAHDVPLSVLATDLSSQLRRTVVDKTGLTGKYDIWLKWTPEELSASMDKGADNGAAADAAPSLFTAIQEQLGLRLQSSKDPVQVLVVDRVEMPTED